MHPAEVEEEDRFWWTRGPVFPPVVRPGPGAGAHLTPASGSSGGGSPADSVTSSPPLRRALIGRNLPRGPSPQLAPLGVGDTSPDSGGGGGGGGNGLRSQGGLLTTVDSGGRMTMYSKPPPLTIPPSVSSGSSSGHIVPPIPPWCQTNMHRQRQYHNPRGAAGYNGPPPGLTSVAYRSFPGPGQALGGALSPPPPPMLTASPSGQPPSPPPTMPGRECKFCKNNGETAQMYRSHSLRNPSDGRLICPVLRDHVCEMCGATGDDAHTRNYCPLNAERKKQAIPLFLKNTRRQSDGHYRL